MVSSTLCSCSIFQQLQNLLNTYYFNYNVIEVISSNEQENNIYCSYDNSDDKHVFIKLMEGQTTHNLNRCELLKDMNVTLQGKTIIKISTEIQLNEDNLTKKLLIVYS